MKKVVKKEEKVEEELDINAIVDEFVGLRDELAVKSKEFSTYKSGVEERMEVLEGILLQHADKLKVESFGTKAGTAFKVKKRYIRAGDWQAFLLWIRKHKYFHLLEKRPAKLATLEIMDKEGIIPPGIEYSEEFEMQIRRS